MAKKIKFNKINGNDIIANSIKTVNQNFELLEETLETHILKGVGSLQVKDVTWKTSGANGPSSIIELTNGNTAKINQIPCADESQSGVITTVNQTISGKKTFKDGIHTDSISDKKNRSIILTDGNTIYIGGNGGIKLIYDSEGNLKDVEYGFLKGLEHFTDKISPENNNSALEFERLRTYIESIKNDFDEKFEEQENDIKNVVESIAELNLDDLINQNDGMVENYFGQPNKMQELYNEWIEHFEEHVGDTFTDIENKKCYKFAKNGDSYEWVHLDESEYSAVIKALLNSLDAKSIADGKCTTFYQEKIPAPCYTGDIWIVKKSFYMNDATQVDYIDGTTTVPEDTVVYYENAMLFCIQDNDTTTPDISVWGKDLSTLSEIQFQKNVETRFGATEDALKDAQNDINEINDDNIFSVFEKRDCLNNTWYTIAGSYVYNEGTDITYDGNKPTENPSEGFLGTSINGSFWNAVQNCIGDNNEISEYNTSLGELISSFKALAQFCKLNGLFESSIESSQFVTSTGNQTTGAVAKKELADLLYNYYREEEECRKSSYISSATTIMNDLVKQEDHKIQNWYINGVPTRQENMPWRKDDEDVSDYTTNDENHIDDTCVDLNSPLGQAVYKFSKYENENEIKEGDIRIIDTGINFYWKNIKSSDVSQIIDTLGIDTYISSLDGSINVFNTTPHDYTYGDIWFFNGFSDEDSQYHGHLDKQQKDMFVEGCIYYCKNTDLKGAVGDSDGDGSHSIRKLLVSEDWANGYSKGNEFITKFANMASDTFLTPIEKNQLIRTFYEISGTNLYGNDNDETDNIIEDIFNDNENNDGSFRFVIRDVVKALLGTEINSYDDLTSFINGESSDSDYDRLVNLVNGIIRKFKDIKNALISCGCLETSVDTDLTQITFNGFENLTKYNGVWNPSVHISMLSDVFTTYYMEEDNLKTFSQQVKNNDLEERLSGEISSIRDISIASLSNAIDSLKKQIDCKISTFYGESLPPNTKHKLSELWDDGNENHINDVYKDTRSTDDGGGKTYIFTERNQDSVINENDDIVIDDDLNYYWKMVENNDISNIIGTLIDEELAKIDGVIQVFSESEYPSNYNYGDIWFFGGIKEDWISDIKSQLSDFITGNIYYCSAIDENGFETFNKNHWTVGSNSGENTQRITHMTSDGWLSVSEKQQLCDEWYKITGIQFGDEYNENNLIEKIESTQQNTGSYYTLVKKYKDNLPNTEDNTTGSDTSDSDTPGSDTPDVPTVVSPFSETEYYAGNTTVDSKVFESYIKNNILTIPPDKDDMFIVAYKMGGEYIKPDNGCKSITISENDKQVESVYLFNLVKDDSITVTDISISVEEGVISINIKIEGEIVECVINGLEESEYSFDNDKKTIDISFNKDRLTNFNTVNIESNIIASLNIEETKENLDNALKNLFNILFVCKCHIQEDTDLSTVDWNSTPVSTNPTLLVNLFNRYYAEERNLSVELTELQITNTIEDPATIQELAEGVGGCGFVLTSLLELKYNNETVGGLDGVTENNDNVGLWFGGTVENANKTLNGTLDGESPVPVIITKNGINSKIGPFRVGNSTTDEHIYIGDESSGNTTIIGKDYISIGATYTDSNTNVKAQENSMIYLNKDGEGSRIGPLKIKKDSENRILTFGNTKQVYSFKKTKDSYVSFGSRSDFKIDGYTFTDETILDKVIQYGSDIVDFDDYTISIDDEPGYETLKPDLK